MPRTRRIILLLLVLAGIAAGIYALRHTLSAFILAFILAYLLDPLLVAMEQRGLRRPWGLALLYLVLGVGSFLTVVFCVPFISGRWESLLHALPLHLQQAKTVLATWKGELSQYYGGEEWGWLLDSVSGNLEQGASRVGAFLYGLGSRLAFNLLNLVLAPILVCFMLYYKGSFQREASGLLPVERREELLALGRELNRDIGGYVRGQLVVSLIVALLSMVALLALGVDYPILNGAFAGLASVLPFVGVILAMLPPLVFAYLEFQNVAILLKVAGAFAVIYFVEGYLIKPLVFKETIKLNPLLTIVMVMACGELMGFWGILLAIPLTSAGRLLFGYLRREYLAMEG